MRAVLDACVLYPTIMREILLASAARGVFEPLWSVRILEEWAHVGARSGKAEELIQRGEIARASIAWPSALVPLTSDPRALWLPDPDDVHVLHAAIDGQAALIITMNLRDFPKSELDVHHIRAIHPDAYLRQAWAEHPTRIEAAVDDVMSEAARLSGQPIDMKATLKRARLPRLAKALTP